MRTLVPFGPSNPLTRLAAVLSPAERRQFADAMLADVLRTVRAAGGDPVVLATEPVDADAPVVVDDRDLSTAVEAAIGGETAVVMADLALATPDALERLYEARGDVVVAPGRGGGTNALVVRHDGFELDYHGASYRAHRENAARVGATVEEVDSLRLGTDIDEPGDLVDLLLLGDGRAVDWLRDAGFRVREADGRAVAERE
ncbi:2-phospho-L-lactate guanylyltransferase [Halocalculus aciditolerans]|uniref:2-phospho-L-lactate guanylyltransferase n=1 Tax=Halocalculus aciditolerans TaxID=1383812 RepID=A0A830F8G5_9EURY|nr:2-phospho-L-lactate guanylyltransferase [Halocalculus aciditolerans]GGL49872.1 2-phospho-L-lactate guanylyltransferase [Halocalculus aciditolerans]